MFVVQIKSTVVGNTLSLRFNSKNIKISAGSFQIDNIPVSEKHIVEIEDTVYEFDVSHLSPGQHRLHLSEGIKYHLRTNAIYTTGELSEYFTIEPKEDINDVVIESPGEQVIDKIEEVTAIIDSKDTLDDLEYDPYDSLEVIRKKKAKLETMVSNEVIVGHKPKYTTISTNKDEFVAKIKFGTTMASIDLGHIRVAVSESNKKLIEDGMILVELDPKDPYAILVTIVDKKLKQDDTMIVLTFDRNAILFNDPENPSNKKTAIRLIFSPRYNYIWSIFDSIVTDIDMSETTENIILNNIYKILLEISSVVPLRLMDVGDITSTLSCVARAGNSPLFNEDPTLANSQGSATTYLSSIELGELGLRWNHINLGNSSSANDSVKARDYRICLSTNKDAQRIKQALLYGTTTFIDSGIESAYAQYMSEVSTWFITGL